MCVWGVCVIFWGGGGSPSALKLAVCPKHARCACSEPASFLHAFDLEDFDWLEFLSRERAQARTPAVCGGTVQWVLSAGGVDRACRCPTSRKVYVFCQNRTPSRERCPPRQSRSSSQPDTARSEIRLIRVGDPVHAKPRAEDICSARGPPSPPSAAGLSSGRVQQDLRDVNENSGHGQSGRLRRISPFAPLRVDLERVPEPFLVSLEMGKLWRKIPALPGPLGFREGTGLAAMGTGGPAGRRSHANLLQGKHGRTLHISSETDGVSWSQLEIS